MNTFLKITLLCLVIILAGCNSDIDDLGDVSEQGIDSTKLIKEDSELFNLIENVVKDEDNDEITETITCVDFEYPFVLLVYNEYRDIINTHTVINDVEFVQILDNVSVGESISVSYPIQTTLADGTSFSVTTNEELSAAIENCKKDDILNNCFLSFACEGESCLWMIPYSEDFEDNTYAGAIFMQNADFTFTFYHLGEEYIGTWIFDYIEDKTFLNINLEGTSAVASDWNENFEVTMFFANNLLIESTQDSRQINFRKICEVEEIISVGDLGPKGGVVAYDKGSYTNGWRYIEVGLQDLQIEEWGCDNTEFINAQFDDIGSGYQNSAAITIIHDSFVDYYNNPSICSTNNNGSVTAKTALTYIINNGDLNDWFVPSIEELRLLHDNLHVNGLGLFADELYWSSTEFDLQNAKAINFVDGTEAEVEKNNAQTLTRVIRYF